MLGSMFGNRAPGLNKLIIFKPNCTYLEIDIWHRNKTVIFSVWATIISARRQPILATDDGDGGVHGLAGQLVIILPVTIHKLVPCSGEMYQIVFHNLDFIDINGTFSIFKMRNLWCWGQTISGGLLRMSKPWHSADVLAPCIARTPGAVKCRIRRSFASASSTAPYHTW